MLLMSHFPNLHIQENAALAPYTTLRVGGPARFLVKAKTEEHVIEALSFAQKHGCPVFILGGGSNLVVSDQGFPGLALKIEISGIETTGRAAVSVAAGEDWDGFVQYCVDRNFAGIECLSGIPGTVGGTPVQNVGAYGEEVSETIVRVRVLDRESLSAAVLTNEECRFSYRTSVFNSTCRDRYVVMRVDFLLRQDGRPRIVYEDLERHFRGIGRDPSIQEVREAILRIRESKGMVLRDEDPESRSAGSFFKNPIVSPDQAKSLEEKARACGLITVSEHIPVFPAPARGVKLAAAWLIERAGFHKGYTCGRAGISSKHTLAVVNRGEASAGEIVDLMHRIQDRVRSLFEIELRPEPVFVGFKDIENLQNSQ